MAETVPHPRIASRDEWQAERDALLVKEKQATRQQDAVSAERRRLPMVPVEKEYTLTGPDGEKTLRDLFEGRHQLVVYHFMFDPEWEKGCPGCTGFVDALGDLSMLNERNTTFTLISRAPSPKLEAYKAERGWDRSWYSSYNSDFNRDFHATLEGGETHGLSVFFLVDDKVYHTYSTYNRGVEPLTDSYSILDVTPYGRQEDWEDSPEGWPQRPTYG